MANYASALPRDNGSSPMQEYPAPVKAVTSVFYRDNLSVSSTITLDPNTDTLEVGTSGGQGAVLRWIPIGETPGGFYTSVVASGLGANFDHYLPPSTFRRFVVPKETGGSGIGGAIGSINGLYQRVAVSGAGAGTSSVMVIQY